MIKIRVFLSFITLLWSMFCVFGFQSKVFAYSLSEPLIQSNINKASKVVNITRDDDYIMIHNVTSSTLLENHYDNEKYNLLIAGYVGFYFAMSHFLSSEKLVKEITFALEASEVYSFIDSYKLIDSDMVDNSYIGLYNILFYKDKIRKIAMKYDSNVQNYINFDNDVKVVMLVDYRSNKELRDIEKRVKRIGIPYTVKKVQDNIVYMEIDYQSLDSNYQELKLRLQENGLDIRESLNKFHLYLL